MIEVIKGDITELAVDVIVNAANNQLAGGGGVDGAIHAAGGPEIMKACQAIGYCATGDAVITSAGKLPAKKIIHTVGPVYHSNDPNQAKLLTSCYEKSLLLAEQHGFSSIAFPNISTGVYGYPKVEAASIAVKTARQVSGTLEQIKRIVFVCFDEDNYKIYRQLLYA